MKKLLCCFVVLIMTGGMIFFGGCGKDDVKEKDYVEDTAIDNEIDDASFVNP